jgi:hypothetical protein
MPIISSGIKYLSHSEVLEILIFKEYQNRMFGTFQVPFSFLEYRDHRNIFLLYMF